MIIYFTIGLVMFLILQFATTSMTMDTQCYHFTKGSAWLSLIIWPLVGIGWGVVLLFYAVCLAIEYIDNNIDRIVRKKK